MSRKQPELRISFQTPYDRIKGHTIFKHIEPNILQPLVYIHKAKHASQKDFDMIMDFLRKASI